MGLNKEQQAAVEYLNGPLLVLAGPGTGKTQLLSAKVAYILEHTDTNPSNILCITFTEAGAENMRSRLQSMIGAAALDVNIHTYHAFGSNLLDRYKNYAENFDRRLDSPIDATTQYKIIYDIQRQLPATDILKNADVNDLISTISNTKTARLSADDLEKIAQQNIHDSAELSRHISPILAAYKTTRKVEAAIENTYRPILEILAKYSSPDPIAGQVERLANSLTRELNQIITSVLAAEKPSVKPLTDWKNRRFEVYQPKPERPDHAPTKLSDLVRENLTIDPEAIPKNNKHYRLKDHIANKKLLSLAQIARAYDQELRARGLFDFDDMIEQAILFLKNDRGFRAELQEQFQFVLLDEFQDTNPSQFELIKLITDYENPIIMAVGDDDQAIFEFQGASASNLRDFREHYQAEVITLLDNYRSTGEILSFARRIAEQITDSFSKNYQVNKTLRAVKDQTRPHEAVEIFRHEFIAPEAEYYWVAQQIRTLLDQGEDPQNIAIIAPKHKNIAPILPYLKNQNINVSYEKRDNLLKDPLVSEITTLARFIYALSQNQPTAHLLLEILSFKCWQIPAEVSVQALDPSDHHEKNALKILERSTHPALQSLRQLFAELVTASFNTPLELWLDYLIGTAKIETSKSPFLSYYEKTLSTSELLEFYENLATLRQTTLQHLRTSAQNNSADSPQLADFIQMLEDFELANTEIMRISLYQDSQDSIQVMTSHKSKGLEFKYVFLITMDDAAWGKSKGNNNKLTLPCNLIQIRHTGASDDEKLRLLFVAITRAKQALYITNSVKRSDGKEVARSRYLAEPSRESAPLSPYLPEAAQNIKLHQDELTDAQKIEVMRLSWVSNYLKLSPDVHDLLLSRVANYRLNASDLTTFIDLIYGGPEQFYRNRVLRAPSDPPTFSLCLGNLLHATFEQITNQNISNEAALQYFLDEAAKAPLDENGRRELLEKGEYALKTSLGDFQNILRHPHAKAEVNFAPEHLHFEDVPITGKIDHLEINPDDKTIEIYDFKTGNYHKGAWNSHSTLYKYRLQLGFYKILVEKSPRYQNYQVTKGHILFVTPDQNNGEVHDAEYDFTASSSAADEKELRQLLPVIYRHIVSLDFLDHPELCPPTNPENQLKDIKNFVAKLLEN